MDNRRERAAEEADAEVTRPQKRSGLPVGRYFLALPIAAVAFMVVAFADQKETFLSAWGLAAPSVPPQAAPSLDSARAEAAVRRFNTVVQEAYRQGSMEPLRAVSMSASVREDLALELAHSTSKTKAAGLALKDFLVLRVEPSSSSGWIVDTDETWVAPGGSHSRLRFRYTLIPDGPGLRVEQMTPVLPEPRP